MLGLPVPTEVTRDVIEVLQVKRGGPISVPGRLRTLFEEYAYRWLKAYKSPPKLREQNYVIVKANLEHHVLPFFEGRYMDDIMPIDLQDYLTSISGYSPPTPAIITENLFCFGSQKRFFHAAPLGIHTVWARPAKSKIWGLATLTRGVLRLLHQITVTKGEPRLRNRRSTRFLGCFCITYFCFFMLSRKSRSSFVHSGFSRISISHSSSSVILSKSGQVVSPKVRYCCGIP